MQVCWVVMTEHLVDIHPILRDRVSSMSDEVHRLKTELADCQKTYDELCFVQSASKWEKIKVAELFRSVESQEKRILGARDPNKYVFT